MKIGGAALNQTPIDWENNLNNIFLAIELAKKEGVKILCLPELCITGYGCEDLFLSDWLSEKAINCLEAIRMKTNGIAVSVGLPIKIDNKVYNTSCIIYNEKIEGITAKQILANDGVHYEKRWFTSWEAEEIISIKINDNSIPFGDVQYDLFGSKVGFEICEDAWNEKDRPGHRLANKGVNIILSPSASHFSFGKHLIREKLVIDSSKKFNCTYIYSNLLGNEAGKIIYDGDILIAQNGKLIQRNEKRLSFQKVIVTSVSIESPLEIAKPPYIKEEEFLKAETLALYDYLRKSKSKGFVISLSGGADSSACAVLCSLMIKHAINELGIDTFLKNLHLPVEKKDIFHITHSLLTYVYQGSVNSSKATYDSAQYLAKELGATFYDWTIDDAVDSAKNKLESSLKRKLTWKQDDIALQNIQARIRSPFIWMLANIKNALLIATSNRSEGDVGYTTMDGDTSGSISPIAGVDKYFIQNWLLWMEKKYSIHALTYVNNLTPTAELRPSSAEQTDEDDLMPYPILLAIEKKAIFERQSPIQVYNILAGKVLVSDLLLKSYIIKFFRLWSRNQWKRERLAPSFHLDDFNVDPRSWCRFPILSGGYDEELNELSS